MFDLMILLFISALFMIIFIAYDSIKAKKKDKKGDKDNGCSRR